MGSGSVERETQWSATWITRQMRDGVLRPDEALEHYQSVIAERDPAINAWAYLPAGGPQAIAPPDTFAKLPLAGVPFGVKDVIDVAGMPTVCGLQGLTPVNSRVDAACVAMLRNAGGIPLGKTVTAEYAFRHPGATRNPHNLAHTPGGSSSGSAAAVAAGMAPFALSTQTGGSIIRPAAFCGVLGFKPSFGVVPRAGLHLTSDSLDVIGWHAGSMEDLQQVGQVLLPSSDALQDRDISSLKVAWLDWSSLAPLEDAGREALTQARHKLETSEVEFVGEVPHAAVSALTQAHDVIMKYEFARNVGPLVASGIAQPSASLRQNVHEGGQVPYSQYREMLAMRHELSRAWRQLAGDADLILTPSTPGTAPEGLEYSGSPAFCKIWSVLGWPCLHLPMGHDRKGLPIGVQLVGPLYRDHELLIWGKQIHSIIKERQNENAF